MAHLRKSRTEEVNWRVPSAVMDTTFSAAHGTIVDATCNAPDTKVKMPTDLFRMYKNDTRLKRRRAINSQSEW
jgi:hypothetical protein